MPPQLDVYVERRSAFLGTANYKLQHMLRGLDGAGLRYRVLDRFCPGEVGDRAFLHVDLTDVPAEFHGFDRHYAGCVNGRAATISRLLYSRARVFSRDAYAGPVIVKTVLNHHGWPELRFAIGRNAVSTLKHALKKWLVPDYEARACPGYVVYPSRTDVPPSVWADPRLLVERFLPGRLDLPIVKHRFDFFYDVGLTLRSTHESLLCDPETVLSVETVDDVPSEVAAVRQALNLDYGAIDYFVVDGQAFVIDANKTVGISPSWVARFPAVARHIALATDRLIEVTRGGRCQ